MTHTTYPLEPRPGDRDEMTKRATSSEGLKKLSFFSGSVRYLALCGVLCALVACSGSSKTISGLGDYTETDCEFVEVATEHSQGEDPFACRGMLWNVNNSFVMVARDAKTNPYMFATLDPKTGAPQAKPVSLPHTTQRPQGIPVDGGVLLYSTQGTKLVMTRHALPSGAFEDQSVTVAREINAVVALPATGSTPAMLAVATEVGAHIFYLNPDGTVHTKVTPLEMAEVPYCSEVFLKPQNDAVEFVVRCEAIRPAAPMNGDVGVFVIPGYDEDSDDLPDASDIVLTLDAKGAATKVDVRDVNDPPPPPTPSGYALKQYMKQNLPRPLGYRAHMLSALDVGENRVLTLSCIGPDLPDGEAPKPKATEKPMPKSRLHTSVLECKNPPK